MVSFKFRRTRNIKEDKGSSMTIQDWIHLILFVGLTILGVCYMWKQYKIINNIKRKDSDTVD